MKKRELIWPKKKTWRNDHHHLQIKLTLISHLQSLHTYTPGFWIYMYLQSRNPPCLVPPFCYCCLLYFQQKQVVAIPKELYSVTRKKFGRSPKIYDSLFLLLPLLLLLFFPFRQIKMGTLVLIMNRMTMLFSSSGTTHLYKCCRQEAYLSSSLGLAILIYR